MPETQNSEVSEAISFGDNLLDRLDQLAQQAAQLSHRARNTSQSIVGASLEKNSGASPSLQSGGLQVRTAFMPAAHGTISDIENSLSSVTAALQEIADAN